MNDRPTRQSRPRLPTFDARELLRFFADDVDDKAIAEALGVGRAKITAWKSGVGTDISLWRADRLSIRIGLHPSIVWGEQWWSVD